MRCICCLFNFTFTRSGDIYEALRDTERTLSLCPAHHKSIKRRIKCLKLLHWTKEARSFLEHYQLQYPEDEEFIKAMDTAISAEQGNLTSSGIMCKYLHYNNNNYYYYCIVSLSVLTSYVHNTLHRFVIVPLFVCLL